MKKQILNWDNLRIFLTVARSQSALEAATKTQMDHSTITRRLHRLEIEINSKLFKRNSQGHQLTEAGHCLLEYAERIESTLAKAESILGGDNQLQSGNVRLGTTEGFGCYFLPQHLTNFCLQYPSLNLDLLAVPRFVNLSKHEADVAITIERPESGPYVVCKLSDYRLQLYAAEQYLNTHPTISTINDLNFHNFIGYVDELIYSKELRYLDKVAKGAKVFLRSTSIVAQLNAVRCGTGLAILPCFMGNTCSDLIPVLPESIDIVRTFWMIVPSERREILRVQTLCDFLRQTVRNNQNFLMGESKQQTYSSVQYPAII